jgi:DNA-binding MarR family transcriptional regulator
LSTQAIRREGVEVQAFAALLRAHSATTRAFNAQLVAEHSLTLSDYEVLLRLARAPECRMRRVDLAEQVLLTPSGITRLLAGLEEDGYVERVSCASDARVTYAQLTESGREKLHAASKTHVADIRSVFGERLSGEELKALRDLLERLPLAGTDACDPC